MKIKRYRVEIHKDKREKDIIEVKEYNVAMQNEKYIILDDFDFTKLLKRAYKNNYSIDKIVGKESIYIRSLGVGLSRYDAVVYNLYTDKNVRWSTIRNHIELYLKDKYGWLNYNNLSFILNQNEK